MALDYSLTCTFVLEIDQIQREAPFNLPPKPPQKRNWRGSVIAPFAANTMLVLYACDGKDPTEIQSSKGPRSKYFVQVLHNEVPVPLPVRLIGNVILSF